MTAHLKASPETCAWGYFDACLDPVMEIASGDTIVIDTVSGGPDHTPPPDAGFTIPAELLDIHARSERMLPGHILTGPVAVAGARAGQVLEVQVVDVKLRQDWGWNLIRPLAGTLPDEFPNGRTEIIPLDLEAMTARLSWGLKLAIEPVFRRHGRGPACKLGPHLHHSATRARRQPGQQGTCRRFDALPANLHVDGALFSCGDGHGAQGDGEVCVTAIETALQGTFRLTVRDDLN
jgi:acetamidase/formamidase